jgi:hypothetical protein
MGFFFACGFATFPAVGIIGRIGFGCIESRSKGCVGIGPAVDLALGMYGNSLSSNSFKKARTPHLN